MKKLISLSIFLSLLLPSIIAQNLPSKNDQIIKAGNEILHLKEGILVFQLHTNHKKFKEIDRLLNSKTVTEKTKRSLQRQRDIDQAKVDAFNEDLISSIKEYYSFSRYVIMYDSENETFKKNPGKAELIYSSMDDSKIKWKDVHYFILKESSTQVNKANALVFFDRNFKALSWPFPYYHKTNRIDKILLGIFSPKKSTKRPGEKIIGKMDLKLAEFYQDIREAMRE